MTAFASIQTSVAAYDKLADGDHVLVNTSGSTGKTYCAMVETLDPLQVRYYHLKKADQPACGSVTNNTCDKSEVARIFIHLPVSPDL